MKNLMFIAIVTCVIAAVDGQSVLTSNTLPGDKKNAQVTYYAPDQNSCASLNTIDNKHIN